MNYLRYSNKLTAQFRNTNAIAFTPPARDKKVDKRSLVEIHEKHLRV
jgi:hypothetical protein